MTLKEKIQECINKTQKIISANPDITNVWYQLHNIPTGEITEHARETGFSYDAESIDDKTVLRLLCGHAGQSVIFAFSVPVKITKTNPEFIE